MIEGRLHQVPRYRQKLAFPPLAQARPVWVDDPHFNVGYHVRHTALPAPAGEEQLRKLAGRVFSQQLDRSKPLWEIWLVDRVGDGRFALDLQDPPRAGRRHLGRRHHDRAVRPRARPAASASRARRGTRGPEPSGATLFGRRAGRARDDAGRPRPVGGRARSAARARPARRRAKTLAGLASMAAAGRRRRAAQPAQRDDRPAPALRVGRERPRPLQGDQERARRDGQRRRARRRSPARCATHLLRRGRDPERARAQGDGAGLDPRRRRSAARSATAWPRCTRRCRSGSRTRSSASRPSTRRSATSRRPARPSGAERLTQLAGFAVADRAQPGGAAAERASGSSTSR